MTTPRFPHRHVQKWLRRCSTGALVLALFVWAADTMRTGGRFEGSSVNISFRVVDSLSSGTGETTPPPTEGISEEGGGRPAPPEPNGGRHPRESAAWRLLQHWADDGSGDVCDDDDPPAGSFSDVTDGAWYAHSVEEFRAAGYLRGETLFEPGRDITRAEFIAFLMRLKHSCRTHAARPLPVAGGFSDVPAHAWYAADVEEAAQLGWVRGDDNCYGTMPCMLRPQDIISRAEASALVNRALNLRLHGAASTFTDVRAPAWYVRDVAMAANACLILGDEGTRRFRPESAMNRAEALVLLQRVFETANGAQLCSPQIAKDTKDDVTHAAPPEEPVVVQTTLNDGRLRRLRSAAPSAENPDPCASPSLPCMAGAMRDDIAHAAASAGELFTWPLRGWADNPGTERTLWILLPLLMAGALLSLWKMGRKLMKSGGAARDPSA